MFNQIAQHFDLGLYSQARFGTSERIRFKKFFWTFIYYFFVCLGVLSNKAVDLMNQGKTIKIFPSHILFSLIMAAVIFPYVYTQAKLKTDEANAMQIFIAFQFGFFFESVLDTIQSGFSS